MNIEAEIVSWIHKTLSRRQTFLGDLPPCPFAAEAVLRGQVGISVISQLSPKMSPSLEDVNVHIKLEMSRFQKKPSRVHVIAVPEWKNFSVDDVKVLVQENRDIFFKQDLWLLYDHPENSEVVQDFSFNHGSLLLFFIQNLSDLVLASEELAKTNYYDQWPKDYKEQVLGQRNEYYRRFLEL